MDSLNYLQQDMLDRHLEATVRRMHNCESLRDPLELKYIQEVATKLYAGLNLPSPKIYILDSPIMCAFLWGHTPQGVADRWRVFHDEFYTHPLSAPIVDLLQNQYSAMHRLVEHSIATSMPFDVSNPAKYQNLERTGDLINTAITATKNPYQNAELIGMFTSQVSKYISNPSISKSVERQPLPSLDTLFLPNDIFRGQHFFKTAYYEAMANLEIPIHENSKNFIQLWQQLSQTFHFWFPYKRVLIISDRHSALHLDNQGRPHNTKEAAIEYRDGWKVFAWKGILVPREIIENPDSLTVSQILNEGNAEIRRAMVDVFGLDRFVVESESKRLDTQGEYELLEVPYLNDIRMIALKMRCPTTSAVYIHSVHPECTNVEQALAWKRGEDDFRYARPYKEGLLWEK